MQLKRCKNCNAAYQAQSTGRAATLCRPCSMDCDTAYMKIHKFLLNPEHKEDFRVVDKDQIAEAVGVPAIFVWVLAQEGKFSGESHGGTRLCARCHIQLGPQDKEHCAQCLQKMSRQFQALSTKEPVPTVSQEALSAPRKERRYGLGR